MKYALLYKEKALKILKHHNQWRRNTDDDNQMGMVDPKELGQAIDFVIEALEIANCDHNDKVTRLEVIDNNGRSYVNWGVDKMEFSYQDDGRTLKIFTNGSGS